MSSRKKAKGAPSSSSSSPPPPPSGRRPNNAGPGGGFNSNNRNQSRRQRRRAYADEKDPRRGGGSGGGSDLSIVLCVFHGTSSGWRTLPLSFRPGRMSDEELWREIRSDYRDRLELLWRRIFLFKKVKAIVPIEFTRNDVPIRQDPKNTPGSHEFMHCYHHPTRVRTHHEWVDWFVQFKQRVGSDKTIGLEFVEGIWAEKLAFVAIVLTIAIIVVSVVWCVMGGNLQTVFTVMGFVLTGVAAYTRLRRASMKADDLRSF